MKNHFIKNKLLIAGLALGAACFIPQGAKAAVRVGVDLHFGTGHGYDGHRYSRGYYPYRHHYYGGYSYYSRPVYVPERVVVVEQPTYSQPNYYELGRNWAKDLRSDRVSWSDFIRFLRDNNITNSSRAYDDFRDGFISSYGVNGNAAFRKAVHQAND